MSNSKKKAAGNHGQKVSLKELATIKRLVREHTPTKEIADVVGRSLVALRKITFRAGVSLRRGVASVKKSVKSSPKKTARKAGKKPRKKSPILIH